MHMCTTRDGVAYASERPKLTSTSRELNSKVYAEMNVERKRKNVTLLKVTDLVAFFFLKR